MLLSAGEGVLAAAKNTNAATAHFDTTPYELPHLFCSYSVWTLISILCGKQSLNNGHDPLVRRMRW